MTENNETNNNAVKIRLAVNQPENGVGGRLDKMLEVIPSPYTQPEFDEISVYGNKKISTEEEPKELPGQATERLRNEIDSPVNQFIDKHISLHVASICTPHRITFHKK